MTRNLIRGAMAAAAVAFLGSAAPLAAQDTGCKTVALNTPPRPDSTTRWMDSTDRFTDSTDRFMDSVDRFMDSTSFWGDSASRRADSLARLQRTLNQGCPRPRGR
jgi:hypothetical protein